MKQKFTPTANAIRALAMDGVQKSNSGHPGAPMGMADIADVLWRNHLKHNPKDPKWINRDRFVLSNGHASMLLYSLLHLSGYDLSIEEIKNFRQLGSKTPGHPEYGHTPGVETTTGPLGQGISNAVGFALAEKLLGAKFNRYGYNVVDHRTYVFVGDGCLMEGISHEACSLAGNWQLNKLIVFYDANEITIDGNIKGWFADNTKTRFESYNWNVIDNVDGHSASAIEKAIVQAKNQTDKPTLIICSTVIGQGSPNKAGSADTHGAPLGDAEIAATRTNIGWNHPPFVIPEDVAKAWCCQEKGALSQKEWNDLFSAYKKEFPDLADELIRRVSQKLPSNFNEKILIEKMRGLDKAIASRKASEICIETLTPLIPELIGGSADLACSNLTETKYSVDITKDATGNKIDYGVREFGMCGIANGIALHGGFRNFVATFLVFSDYARNAIRMAALMRLPITYVFTHDSIGLGEDGPTHQPVEHIPSLRLIPNLNVWRPCDAVETAVAWNSGLTQNKSPTILALSRQALNPQTRTAEQEKNINKGGYVLADCEKPQAVIIATGSEVSLAISAKVELVKKGINVRVVSMPCAEIFANEDIKYQNEVLPDNLPRVAIEASHTHYWKAWVGLLGAVVGINTFGDSAPAGKLYPHFNITVENLINCVEKVISTK